MSTSSSTDASVDLLPPSRAGAAADLGSGNKPVIAGAVVDSDISNEGFSSNMERLVRFEDTCVVIPEHEKPSIVPKIVSKSYSVSLWKRGRFRTRNQSDVEVDKVDGLSEGEPQTENVTVTVTVPSLRRSSSLKSPTRHMTVPVTPCLIHRDSNDASNSSANPLRTTMKRATSLSPVRSRRHDETSLITIPLRPCCVACLHNAEIKDHNFCSEEDWNNGVKFTKGALKLYRSSLVHKKKVGPWNPNSTYLNSESIVGSVPALMTSLKVDEVDKKFGGEKTEAESPLGSPSFLDGREASSDSESESQNKIDIYCRRARRAYPPSLILEGDEDGSEDLFPLPSPRRTPTSSPFASTSCINLVTSTQEQLPTSVTNSHGRLYGKHKSASMSENFIPRLSSLPIPIGGMQSNPDFTSPSFSSDINDFEISDTASSTIAMEDAHSPSAPLPIPSTLPAKKRRPSFPTPSEFLRASAGMLRGMSFGASTVMGTTGFSP